MSDKEEKGGLKSFKISFGTGSSSANDEGVVPEKGTFRLVVLGELAPRHDYATAAPPTDEPRAIDKYTFDQRLAELAPSLAIELPDPFDAGAPALRVDVRFSDLRSFRPDGLAEGVSVLRALLEARKVLSAVRDRKTDPSAARTSLARILPRSEWAEALSIEAGAPGKPMSPDAAPTTPQTVSASTGLEALFQKIDVGEHEARADAIVAAVAKSATRGDRPKPAGDVTSALKRVERAFVDLLGGVLRHPEVRRLERRWRGLKLLVERVNTKAGVEVDVVVAARDEVANAMRKLLERSGAESIRAPIDLFVVDDEISPTPNELAAVESWGEIAEAFRAPVITNGTTSLLGFDDIPTLQKSERRLESLDDARAAALRGVCSREPSRWLSIALNGILVRPAYEPSTSRFREIPFGENARDASSHVFAGPAYALAILAAASWTRNKWASEIVGPKHGVVENLPVREVEAEGAHYAFPLEHLVSIDTQASVARTGLTLLGCAPNHDAAVVARAPTLFRGPSVARGGDSPPQSSLGDQLFAARLSHAVEQLAAAIPEGAPANAIDEVARVTLAELFSAGGRRGPDVRTRVDGGVLEVTVLPHGFAGVTAPEITLAAKLAG